MQTDDTVADAEGLELPDLAAAHALAEDTVAFELAEDIRNKRGINLTHRIDIETEYGQVLSTVHFRDVVKIEGR